MHWKSRSIRDAGESDPNGEAILRSGSRSWRRGSGRLSAGRLRPRRLRPAWLKPVQNVGTARQSARRQAQPAHRPDPAADSPETPNSVPETADLAQPSDADGVPEDMATLVLDNPALGAGSASRPDATARCVQRHRLRRGRVKRCGRHAARGGGRRSRASTTWWKSITGP